MKLAGAIIRAALMLAVILALLLFAARLAQAQTETVLYSFTGGSDGGAPQSSLVLDAAGNLYGTTNSGGLGYGIVFELSPNGNVGWNETVIYAFTGGADGGVPSLSNVVFDRAGNLYGTTSSGGAYGGGVVFELSPAGSSWTETVLHSFCSQAHCSDGSWPVNNLIMDPAGNLYGRAVNGGEGYGIVFELSPSDGDWTEQTIYELTTAGSYAGLTMDGAGNIFGTTDSTVFELSPNGDGGWNPSTIYNFGGDVNVVGTPVLDQAGNLYGTTVNGGASGWGSVYELSPGNGTWPEKDLYSFKKGDGVSAGVVFDAAGSIYGVEQYAGKYGSGKLFELMAGEGFQEKTIWTFNIKDGSGPLGSLILDSAGRLYGTTYWGGSNQDGVVFEATPPTVGTKTTLTSSPNPSTYGEAVTLTAVITSKLGAPPNGETVSFMAGKTVLGTGTLSDGSASLATSTLKVGETTITAAYSGYANFHAGKSKAVRQVVEAAGK